MWTTLTNFPLDNLTVLSYGPPNALPMDSFDAAPKWTVFVRFPKDRLGDLCRGPPNTLALTTLV